jgi:hypothetical protein
VLGAHHGVFAGPCRESGLGSGHGGIYVILCSFGN